MRKYSVSRTHQQGVALIVVLLFLILIALAGAMAVRQSNTDLKTATADQINTLLLQSSDSANQRLEAILASSGSATYRDALGSSGMFGHYLPTGEGEAINNIGDEYIYCYNPRGTKYLKDNATIRKASGGTLGSDVGICNYNSADSYTSSRKTVMTQVNMIAVAPPTPPAPASGTAISALPTTNGKAFENMVTGTDTKTRGTTSLLLDIRTTSILPAYSEPTDSNGSCLNRTSQPDGNGNSPILSCLHTANTPAKVLYEHATVKPNNTTINCYEAGASATMNAACN